MATTKSDLMANVTASPWVANAGAVDGANVKVKMGTVTITTGTITTVGSDILRLCRLPVEGRIVKIELFGATLDTGTSLTIDVGLYKVGGATAVDQNCYATISEVFQDTTVAYPAATAYQHNWRFEALSPGSIEQNIWEDAGLSAKPDYGEMELCITSVTGAQTAVTTGYLSFIVWYTE